LDQAGNGATDPQKSGFYIGLNNYPLVSQNGGSVVVDANLFLAASPELDFDMDLSGLHKLAVGANFDEAINAALQVTGSVNWSDQIELTKIYLAPIVIPVPVGPI